MEGGRMEEVRLTKTNSSRNLQLATLVQMSTKS